MVRIEKREPPVERRPGPFSLRSVVTALIAVGLVVVAVLAVAYQTCGFEGCPPVEQVQGYLPEEASIVVDRDEEEIGRLFLVNRVVVSLDSLPEYVAQAFVATEDQEFYDHGGVDWSRVLGAAWQNVRSGGIAEGFSTITMQVARNVFPDRLPVRERTLNRKISEIKVARQLEGRYSKEEILELYVNQIYFGSGAWGIEAAAREYFGKPATELTLPEAALLAGLPQAPSRLNPRENLDGALERRRTVLDRMEREGYITAEEAREAGEHEPELASSRGRSPERAAYFIEHVRRVVEERLGDAVYTGGYVIHTTLDLATQAVAEEELRRQLEDIESGRYGPFPHSTYAPAGGNGADGRRTTPYLQGAVVTMAVNSGDVLALVGGRDFEDSRYNRATQARRQPGSAFKPFVYAAALQDGFTPITILEDTPLRMERDGRVWTPGNYDGSYAGEVTVRNALVQSRNVATIRLAEQVGLNRVIDTAQRLGLSGDLPPYPSIAIGAAEATLLEMVAAYAAFASLGDLPSPRVITRITDRHGQVVWQEPPRSRHVLDSDVAFLTVDLMRDVVDRGTGTAVRAVGFRQPAAGKTGTTNESADVWFIGFTPSVVTGVWIGLDEPQRIMARATGGRLAAPVWGRIMSRVAAGGGGWTAPPGIERLQVDSAGNVVGTGCPTFGPIHEEYFIRGTVSAYGCRDLAGWDDSLYYDSLYAEEDSWWRRLRDRVLGHDDQPGDTVHDTIILGPRRPGADTLGDPSDTLRPYPDTLRPYPPDTMPRPLGRDTILRDTILRDTVPPDTGPPAPAAGVRDDLAPAATDTSRGV